MVFAARAAGIMPLGFIASVAGFATGRPSPDMVRRSRRFGFMGAGCIHQGQVPIVNREYSPSPDEVAYARRIVEENAKHEAAGRASWVARRPEMIDGTLWWYAPGRLLARHAAIPRRARRRSPPSSMRMTPRSLSSQLVGPAWVAVGCVRRRCGGGPSLR